MSTAPAPISPLSPLAPEPSCTLRQVVFGLVLCSRPLMCQTLLGSYSLGADPAGTRAPLHAFLQFYWILFLEFYGGDIIAAYNAGHKGAVEVLRQIYFYLACNVRAWPVQDQAHACMID